MTFCEGKLDLPARDYTYSNMLNSTRKSDSLLPEGSCHYGDMDRYAEVLNHLVELQTAPGNDFEPDKPVRQL